MEVLIVPLIAFSIPVNIDAIMYYMLFQIGYNVYGHLGFELLPKNTNRHWLGKYFNTSVSHNMHHKFFVKNYGLWTTIWDRMMGTMHAKYDETYERTTGGSSVISETFINENLQDVNSLQLNMNTTESRH